MANKRKEALSLTSIKKHVLRIFKDKWFSAVTDGRSDKNKIWNFDYAMEVLLTGLLGGAKTLREIETHSMNYEERIPDTTLENIMAKANPEKLPGLIARQIKQASRDHELEISRENASSSYTTEYNGNDVSYHLYRGKINENFLSMPEIRQVWRIEKEIVNIKTGEVTTENRYYITSIPSSDISSRQCLTAVRAHWGIENNANWTFDCQFGEDDFPLTTRAMSLVASMRILAYNCITRFKYRKLRKRENKELSWKRLFECFKFALFALRTQKRKETPAFV